jgi:hypothetical protein
VPLPQSGEQGGAYGGDTTGNTGKLDFQQTDRSSDGKVSRDEARAGGIERFEMADGNQDRKRDRIEFAILERGGFRIGLH